MKKTKSVLMLVFVLCFSLTLPVFAASSQVYLNSENFDLIYVSVSKDQGASWVSPQSSSFTTLSNGWGYLAVSYPNGNAHPFLKARFDPLSDAGNLVVQPYMQLNCNLQLFHEFGSEQYSAQTLSGALYLVSPDGVIYEFPLVSQMLSDDKSFSMVTLGGTAEIVEGFRFQDCYIELRMSGVTNVGGVELKFQNLNLTAEEYISEETVKIVDSIDKGFADLQDRIEQGTQDIIDNQDQNTQDIIDNNNQNTQDIIDNQNQNTQDIINGDLGYSESDEQEEAKNGILQLANKVDSLSGDINDSLAKFSSSIDGIKSSLNAGKSFVWGWLDYVPSWFVALIVGFGGILVARKIVK